MIEPKIRGSICMNAHPAGCVQEVRNQIKTVENAHIRGDDDLPSRGRPKNVLVIGGSTGYGLASRIVSSFGYGASTINVSFEREPSEKKSGTPGWYNNHAFDREAERRGIYAKSFHGDAFSHRMKADVASLIEERGEKIDLLVYSLASGLRIDPDTGETFKSVLKPVGSAYTTRSLDVMKGTLSEVTMEPASEEEIEATVKVMGGEDWDLWVRALKERGLLSDNFTTLAYSYIGPEVTHPIYRSGTIGRAKEHLEETATRITGELGSTAGGAFVSINKAVVTRASSVIPAVPLYIGLLFSVMKNKGLHEGCIEQMVRLFGSRLYTGSEIPTDEEGRIRVDDWEMRDDVQAEVSRRWDEVTEETLGEMADLEGYREDFLRIHGFSVPGVDYSRELSYTDVPDL
jgi:enoyl-[acyl-carrier protein] reductase/trans-2-enoyl-CoA reductase (NAD+)